MKYYKIISIIIIVILLGAVLCLLLKDKTITTSQPNTNINHNTSVSLDLSETSTNGINKTFTSQTHHFVFTTDFDFSHFDNPPIDQELASYTLTRPNSNTSLSQQRDTPNKFNTSSEDRIGIIVYNNNQGIVTNNIDAFTAWFSTASLSTGIEGELTEHVFDHTAAIEAILADGIDSFGRALFFINDDYIVQVVSDDVTKDEMYNIADTFQFDK